MAEPTLAEGRTLLSDPLRCIFLPEGTLTPGKTSRLEYRVSRRREGNFAGLDTYSGCADIVSCEVNTGENFDRD